MSDLALYRKYRPETFDDVIGQDSIVNVLTSAVKDNKIAHAYLFSGSRGIGKTSIARIFARAVGTKESDLYEIDAASQTSVDDIRALNDAVHVLPFESPYKVYILDEVHMLSKAAFNALLKTLEEPPAHVVFILATTEEHKVPETVASRCQTFVFAKPTQGVLKEVVLQTAKKEGYSLERSSADLIALLGDGSFRDTLGILQKVITASKDKKISAEEVEMVTGAPKGDIINGFIEALARGKAPEALELIRQAVAQGVSPKVFVKLVLQKMRFIVLSRFSPKVGKDMESMFSEGDLAILGELAKDKTAKVTSETLISLLNAEEMIGRSYIPELPLELAVIKLLADNG